MMMMMLLLAALSARAEMSAIIRDFLHATIVAVITALFSAMSVDPAHPGTVCDNCFTCHFDFLPRLMVDD